MNKTRRMRHEKAVDRIRRLEALIEAGQSEHDLVLGIMDDYEPGYERHVDKGGIYFTPHELVVAAFGGVSLGIGRGSRVLDLCAGIGTLAWVARHEVIFDWQEAEYTCIERDPEFVAHGQQLCPWATWICADMVDVIDQVRGQFDIVLMNPPFGAVKDGDDPYGFPDTLYTALAIGWEALEPEGEMGVFLPPRALWEASGRSSLLGKLIDFSQPVQKAKRFLEWIAEDSFENDWIASWQLIPTLFGVTQKWKDTGISVDYWQVRKNLYV